MASPEPPTQHLPSSESSEEAGEVDDDTESDSSLRGPYTIRSYGVDYTVDSLVKRMDTGAFIIPEFQRKFLWSKTRASRFIESLLMGLPVPGIFLYKRPEDGRHLVIDGQQRLRTLHGFYKGLFRDSKFSLTGVREPWNGLSYDELEAEDQLRLDDSIMHAIIFGQESPRDSIDSIHFVFERINSSGTRLSSQEIRNCIAEGKFIRLTAELNENKYWRKIYGKPSLRSKDQELITRVLAFLERGDAYERPMATFLTEFAKDMNNASPQKLALLRRSFEETVELCWNALNGSAFRPVRALNAAVLDAIMSEVARRLRQTGPAPSADAIKRAYEQLIESSDFREGWERATADEDVVKKRMSLARNAFSNI